MITNITAPITEPRTISNAMPLPLISIGLAKPAISPTKDFPFMTTSAAT